MDQQKLDTLQREYSEIKLASKELAEREAKVKKEIEDMLPQEPTDIKTPYGTFKMVVNRKWQYSPAVERLTEDLKILKVEEEEQGLATATETYGLRFNAPKTDK